MNKSNHGFGLVDTIVVIGIVGVLAAIATPRYQDYIVKTQHAEAVSAIESLKPQVVQSLIKTGNCPTDLTSTEKYGQVTVSGTASIENLKVANARLKTGCALSYKFNTSNVNKRLSGKVLVVDLFNNGQLSKASQTTVDARYIPVALATITEDPKPATTITTETAYVAKDTEAIVELPTDVVIDLGSLPSLVVDVVGGVKVVPSINIYDLVTKTYPTLPPKTTIEIPSDMIIIGFTDGSITSVANGAIVIDSRWPSETGLTIINKGKIVGYGGAGGGFINSRGAYCQSGKPGGAAIYNQTTYNIVIDNYGTVAGGGGGGGCGLRGGAGGVKIRAGGGGVPYGPGGNNGYGKYGDGTSASLSTPGRASDPGGNGGGIGAKGINGWTNDNRSGSFSGGAAGPRSVGPVTINQK